MCLDTEKLPDLDAAFAPPVVCGTADLTTFAYRGNSFESLIDRVERFHDGQPRLAGDAGRIYDTAIANQLAFSRAAGLNLQDAALDLHQTFRVGSAGPRALRVLALAAPGDLMANTPLDFLTNYLDVRLDVLYLLPDRRLPPVIPDHDVAFFSVGEADEALQRRLRTLFAAWPRPVLNDPRFLPTLSRDALSRSLRGVEGICSPTAVAVSRASLAAHIRDGLPIDGFPARHGMYPCLLRPLSSHAGSGLTRVGTPAELAEHLRLSTTREYFVTAFEDYSGADGIYRKSRVAFIDRQPFLCHMAISRHWMVHYLNAGMTESAAKRSEEAAAMAGFDDGFARRHADAFAALHERLGFDYYSIDCAESRDGRLLVFEADTAAIVHLMDPPDLFAYKQPQMRRVFAAFGDMLRRRAADAAAKPASAGGKRGVRPDRSVREPAVPASV